MVKKVVLAAILAAAPAAALEARKGAAKRGVLDQLQKIEIPHEVLEQLTKANEQFNKVAHTAYDNVAGAAPVVVNGAQEAYAAALPYIEHYGAAAMQGIQHTVDESYERGLCESTKFWLNYKMKRVNNMELAANQEFLRLEQEEPSEGVVLLPEDVEAATNAVLLEERKLHVMKTLHGTLESGTTLAADLGLDLTEGKDMAEARMKLEISDSCKKCYEDLLQRVPPMQDIVAKDKASMDNMLGHVPAFLEPQAKLAADMRAELDKMTGGSGTPQGNLHSVLQVVDWAKAQVLTCIASLFP